MEGWVSALLWYWLPLALVPFGIWLTLARESKLAQKLGLPLVVAGIIFVMASPWTAPESDSSASGHLLLSVAGPVLLLAWGCFLAIFGGQVAVERLPPIARKGGYLAIIIGLVWLVYMFFELPPIWRGEVNPFWGIWWAVFLLTSILASGVLAQMTYVMGDMRGRETSLMAMICGGYILLGPIYFMNIATRWSSAPEFRAEIWLASADLIGTLLGIILAIGVFALVIATYEKGLPEPGRTEPLNDEQKERVTEILEKVLRGD